ncbi:MAG: transporter protein [Thermoproteota archaeon]|nr:transporter protein [Thermoproteota archaeon]
MPSIEAINLSKRYGSFYALSNLSIKIEGSKCVGYLGPNGAGKTTTLKLFTDMIRPSEGKAIINGMSVHENKKKALEHCGALIESPEIYPSFTPREALSMVAEIRGVPHSEIYKRIDEVLAEVKMVEWADKRVGKFSKGMKQRINIAAALLSEPNVVLLDEPTLGLDPRGMTEVRDIVKSLKKQNRLILMSSHLLNEISEICDEVALIDHGKLIIYDTIENVIAKFSGNGGVELAEVILSRPIDDSQLKIVSSLSSVVSTEEVNSTHLNIKFNSDRENQERLLFDLVSMRIGVISFRLSSSALEETYLRVIKDTV